MDKFQVYIIYSDTFDVFYKGITTDFEKRLNAHNAGLSRYTTDKGPWRCVYLKTFSTKHDALVEERRIKRLNRASLMRLISHMP